MEIAEQKILIVVPHLNRGGAERILLNYGKSLVTGNGLKVRVLVIGGQGPLYSEFKGLLDFEFLNKKLSNSFIAYSRALRKNRYSIIVTSHYTTALLVQVGQMCFGKSKHVARVPGSPVFERDTSYYGSFRRLLFGWSLRRSNIVISQTTQMKDEITAVFGVSEEKIMVIPNPIDADRLNRARPISFSRPTVVAAGRLHHVKGFDLLIEAIHRVNKKGIQLDCLIIGSDVGQKASLLNIIQRLKLEDCIKILPDTEQLLNYIAGSDGFILSSRSEGMPNVLLEALHLGIPCVSTNCFGAVENLIIHGSNGLVCDVSVQDLANSIEKLMNTDWNIAPLERQQGSILELINSLNV